MVLGSQNDPVSFSVKTFRFHLVIFWHFLTLAQLAGP